jgi:thiamine biosynthesis lipoprotein
MQGRGLPLTGAKTLALWARFFALLALPALPGCRAPDVGGSREAGSPSPGGSASVAAGGSAAVAPERRMLSFERACMGTHCTIAVFHHDEPRVEQAVAQAVLEMNRLDALMTTWTDTSEVSRINAAAGNGEAVSVSAETFDVLEKSLWVARASGGAFDITVGAFKGLWKFDEDNDGTVPATAAVAERLKQVDYKGLILDPARRTARLARAGQSITLGGIAKGYIVDCAVKTLRSSGLTDFLVQAGGDLFASGKRGDREWRVGIQDPRAKVGDGRSVDTSFALLSLSDSAFNTSGDYERFVLQGGKRYHHILDPRTGHPVTHTRSVTVLAPTSFIADTLDTAAFVLGPAKGLELVDSVPGALAVIVDAENQVHTSRGLRDRLQILRTPTDGL